MINHARQLEHQARHISVAQVAAAARIAAHADQPDILGAPGMSWKTSAHCVADLVGIPLVEARRRLDRATGLETLPASSEKFYAGEISIENVDRLINFVNRLRTYGEQRGIQVEDHINASEDMWSRRAAKLSPQRFTRACSEWLNAFGHQADPTGPAPSDVLRTKNLGVWFKEFPDVVEINIRTTKVGAEIFKSVVFPAGNPRLKDNEDRPRELAMHDTLLAALKAALKSKDSGIPLVRGSASTVLTTMDFDTLVTQHPKLSGSSGQHPYRCELQYTGPVSPAEASALVCDADLLPVVLSGPSTVLHFGRRRRLFSPNQLLALSVRDRGCIAPGCTLPAPWCDAHHTPDFEKGGVTDVNHGVLLCHAHHQAVHQGKWQILWDGDTPWLKPAAWLDSQQELVRNSYWDELEPENPVPRQASLEPPSEKPAGDMPA